MYLKYLIGAVFSFSLVFGMLAASQSDFVSILIWLVPVNIGYFLLLYLSKNDPSISFYLFIAVVIRISLVFTTPNLSDDYFRFFWDGNVSIQGENPYDKRPSELITSSAIERDHYLFRHLNSPEYHSVYPPFLQYLFKYSMKMGDNRLDKDLLILKILYALFSIGMVFLLPIILKLYDLKPWRAMIYLLNPLVLIEEIGNLHAEGIMVFFLALFFLFLKKFPQYAFLPFSSAVVVKLSPLLLLPSILWRLSLRQRFVFCFGLLLIIVISFYPYADGLMRGGFFKSLTLYFNALEFNAFGYNLFKYWGYLIFGYNKIKLLGPLTACISLILILYFSINKRKGVWESFPLQCLILYFIHLFFSPVVHPWYLIPLVFFSVFNRIYFVIVWTTFSMLSYSHYHGGMNKEQYYLVFIEYAVVLIVLWTDFSQKRFDTVA
jgi:hypothetical protein